MLIISSSHLNMKYVMILVSFEITMTDSYKKNAQVLHLSPMEAFSHLPYLPK